MFKIHRTFYMGLLIICGVWGIGILALALGNKLGFEYGFYWPMGQDIDWMLILKQGVGSLAANQEFTMDHRNPLSAWFYSLVSPLILNFEYGFHFLHLFICLVLGISVYCLIWQFCLGRALSYSVTVGSIVSLWWFWSNASQVVSVMLMVLALSLLTVWSYCVYVDSERTRGIFYGWSIVLWLLAISTYTIQCGAIIPIFLIAVFRGRSRGIYVAMRDTLPYVLVGIAFIGIWIAAQYGFFLDSSVAKTTHIHISLQQLFYSMRYFLWHPSFSVLFNKALSYRSIPTIALLVSCFAIFMFFILRATFKATDYEGNYFKHGALWTIMTAIGLAVPTLMIEASSTTWVPGTRSDMMLAAFIPMVFLSVVLFITRIRRVKYVMFISASILGSSILLLDLQQSREGVAVMQWQRNLMIGLAPLQRAVNEPLHFIVLSQGVNNIGATIADRFVQDKLNRVPARWSAQSGLTEVTMRIVPTQPAPSNYAGDWRVIFEPEGVRGVLNESSLMIPYDSVRVVTFDGKKVIALSRLNAQDLIGSEAEIKTNAPILLNK